MAKLGALTVLENKREAKHDLIINNLGFFITRPKNCDIFDQFNAFHLCLNIRVPSHYQNKWVDEAQGQPTKCLLARVKHALCIVVLVWCGSRLVCPCCCCCCCWWCWLLLCWAGSLQLLLPHGRATKNVSLVGISQTPKEVAAASVLGQALLLTGFELVWIRFSLW